MINLDKLPFTFDSMIEHLEQKKNFSLSRWGDGEWMCLLGTFEGRNTDGHEYFSDLGQELREILLQGGNGEILALQSLACKDLGHLIGFQNLVKANNWKANAEILSRNHDRDSEFFNALNSRHVILVGNGYLREAPFNYDTFIEIPIKNCWLEYHRILDQIEPEKDVVILYAASMMANVLINDFHSDLYTQIDVGSFIDPYVGRMTRRYHHNLELI